MLSNELFYLGICFPLLLCLVLAGGIVLIRELEKGKREASVRLRVFVFCVNTLYLLFLGLLTIVIFYYGVEKKVQNGGIFLLALIVIGKTLFFIGYILKGIWRRPAVPEEKEKSAEQPQTYSGDSTEKRILKQLIYLFEQERIYRKPDLRIDEVARSIGTNRTYVSAVIHKQFSVGFGGFVNSYRIRETQELLRSTNRPIREIAEMAGFNSLSAFNNYFREVHGLSPTDWKKKNGIC